MACNIDRHVGPWPVEMAQEERRLAARAAADFDHDGKCADGVGYLGSMRLEQGDLGPCQVILVEAGNVLEQFRTLPVVKPGAGNAFLRLRQAVERGPGEGGAAIQ